MARPPNRAEGAWIAERKRHDDSEGGSPGGGGMGKIAGVNETLYEKHICRCKGLETEVRLVYSSLFPWPIITGQVTAS